MSTPMAFWTEADVWGYLESRQLEYCSIYDGMVYKQTGCMFCMFGLEQDLKKGQPNKFQLMRVTHPTMWRYCMEQLGLRGVLEYMGYPYE